MTNTESIGITINTPNAGGVFDNGALAAVGYFLGYFFAIMMFIWVVFSIYAAYKILLSQGSDKDMQKGFTLIKNVWISITWGMVFFVAISIIGSFTGIGDISQWYYQLAQCKGKGFYFQDISAHQIAEIPIDKVFCCKMKINLKGAAEPYKSLNFKEGTYHFIGTGGADPIQSYFDECEPFR